MRGVLLTLAAASLLGATQPGAVAQEAVRFDRPIFTTDATILCPRQGDIAALRRATEADDRAAAERITNRTCRVPGPDIRLAVVTMPGLYDPDVEVRIVSAPGVDPGLPRGRTWTLKTMVRN